MDTKIIPVRDIEANVGQIDGLPTNPRRIGEAELASLKKSLRDCRIMTALREIIVVPGTDGKYVAVAGNQRLAALREDGAAAAVPCIVLADATKEELQAIAILDNVHHGRWDAGMLAAEWNEEELLQAMVKITDTLEQISAEDYGQDFSLPEGEQKDERTVTFYLIQAQSAEIVPIIERLAGLTGGTTASAIITIMQDIDIIPSRERES